MENALFQLDSLVIIAKFVLWMSSKNRSNYPFQCNELTTGFFGYTRTRNGRIYSCSGTEQQTL